MVDPVLRIAFSCMCCDITFLNYQKGRYGPLKVGFGAVISLLLCPRYPFVTDVFCLCVMFSWRLTNKLSNGGISLISVYLKPPKSLRRTKSSPLNLFPLRVDAL